VQTERWHVARLTLLGRFFADHKRGDAESVATRAIGAIGFYSGMRVLDFNGIVDPHIAHLPIDPQDRGLHLPGHEREATAYIFSLEPTYYVFDRVLTPEPMPFPSFGPALDAQVRAAYDLRAVRLVDEANGEQGWFSFLERKPPQRGAATTK